MNQREELFECETENTHEPCDKTNIFVLDKEREGLGLRSQSPILCQRCLQVFILSWVVGWGWSPAKTNLSRRCLWMTQKIQNPCWATEVNKDKKTISIRLFWSLIIEPFSGWVYSIRSVRIGASSRLESSSSGREGEAEIGLWLNINVIDISLK